jgi:mRNA-degrading endonuclease RelE of RelBE toxin-antitoxin system
VACHAEVTKAQQKELKELRKKAKELLRNAINQQKDDVSSSLDFKLSFNLLSLEFFFPKI